MKASGIIYFNGINALRFFAAFAVIITHIELLKPSFGFETYWNQPIVFELGSLGVYFFFVLSGFLITYLLLLEKQKNGKIEIKKFYLRRILRIWPLYYVVLIFGFLILPYFTEIKITYLERAFNENFTSNLLLYLLILPNVALSVFPAVPHIGQLWSIGVEEQFYIIWPWLVQKSKNVFKTILYTFLGILIIKFVYLLVGSFYKNSNWYTPVKLFLAMSKFECMAIGGMGAYAFFVNHERILSVLKNKLLLISTLPLILILVYFTPKFIQDAIHLVYSFLFLVCIIQVITNALFSNLLENKIFSYLGKISYGIYMYHFMIIPIVLFFIKKYFGTENNMQTNCLIYFITISATIIISGLSFEFLEKWFINLKSKFALIQSKF